MTKASRSKGKRGELEAGAWLRTLLGDQKIERRLDQTREGGADLKGTMLEPFACEVKRVEAPQLLSWFDKLHPELEHGQIPIIIWRPNGASWRIFAEVPPLRFRQLARFFNAIGQPE